MDIGKKMSKKICRQNSLAARTGQSGLDSWDRIDGTNSQTMRHIQKSNNSTNIIGLP
jgi:hypothetical protein